MTLSLFSIIYIGKQHSPSEGPIRGAVEDHPLVRGNNPMKKVTRIDNGMVNINAEYKFGYWSDFLAVAPGVELPREMR